MHAQTKKCRDHGVVTTQCDLCGAFEADFRDSHALSQPWMACPCQADVRDLETGSEQGLMDDHEIATTISSRKSPPSCLHIISLSRMRIFFSQPRGAVNTEVFIGA